MSYSVVIPSLANEKTKPYLELCVKSLRESGFDGQIIVVTNGTTAPIPLPEIANMCVRLHTRDQGQCNAVNIGAQIATGDYLMISNDDMYFAPYWGNYLRFDDPVFSPNLVEPTDNAGSARPFMKLDGGFTIEAFDKGKVDEFVEEWGYKFSGRATPIREEPGFNLPFFIKRDLWNLLGGYDTAYDPWGSNSDTDLQTRINLAGVIPMRLRDVLVYHFSNKSGTFDGTHQDFYQNNLEYFKDKFGFDRDELGSDVWYNKDMIPTDESKIKYQHEKYNG